MQKGLGGRIADWGDNFSETLEALVDDTYELLPPSTNASNEVMASSRV